MGKKRNAAFGGWQLEKWRYCWWFVGLMWTEVRKPDLSGSGKSDRVATIEVLKEKEKRIMTMSSINLSQRSSLNR